MSDFNQLKSLLQLIRSTTKPVEEDFAKQKSNAQVLNNQWDEVDKLLAEMEMAEAKAAEAGGSAVIAAKVKEVLDKFYPGAVLREDGLANNSNPKVIIFSQGNDGYRFIDIDAQ